jgi:hypothetical protein
VEVLGLAGDNPKIPPVGQTPSGDCSEPHARQFHVQDRLATQQVKAVRQVHLRNNMLGFRFVSSPPIVLGAAPGAGACLSRSISHPESPSEQRVPVLSPAQLSTSAGSFLATILERSVERT